MKEDKRLTLKHEAHYTLPDPDHRTDLIKLKVCVCACMPVQVQKCVSCYLIMLLCSSCHTWILSSHWSLLSLCWSRTLRTGDVRVKNTSHTNTLAERWHLSDKSEMMIKKTVLPLREQLFTRQIAWCVDFLVVVSILGLHCVGGQEDSGLWRTVDVVI